MKKVILLFTATILLFIQIAYAENQWEFKNVIIFEQNGSYGIKDQDGTILLNPDYFIDLNEIEDEIEEYYSSCIYVYQVTDHSRIYGRDIDAELQDGRLLIGFFHTETFYFSGCNWKYAWILEDYAAVENDEGKFALLRADTGELVFDYQYYCIYPEINDGDWFYATLETDEWIDEWSAWNTENVYINLDGRILHAPNGYYFSEEVEPIVDGKVLVICEDSGNELWIGIDELE